MKIKQQVGECWVCVIFFACVCVGTSGLTTASDDATSSTLCAVCIERFPRGVPRGARYAPPGYAQCLATSGSPRQRLKFIFGPFFLFLMDFSIFSGFLN